ncbi:MAG TPA: hypothetical protein VMH41_01175 [Mycobacteriales bacterium]|nr:hypothetical protein [Mycobacteriales bacterium]
MKQRRLAVAIVCVASAASLSACGFDSPAVTTTEHAEVQGSSFDVGLVKVRAAFVTEPVAASTSPDAVEAPYLVVTFVNDGARTDRLTGVTTPIGTVTISGTGTAGGQLPLPPGVPVQFLDPFISSDGPLARINTSTAAPAGTSVRMTFAFANTGATATTQVPVVPPGETTAVTTPLPGTPAPVPTQVGETSNE